MVESMAKRLSCGRANRRVRLVGQISQYIWSTMEEMELYQERFDHGRFKCSSSALTFRPRWQHDVDCPQRWPALHRQSYAVAL